MCMQKISTILLKRPSIFLYFYSFTSSYTCEIIIVDEMRPIPWAVLSFYYDFRLPKKKNIAANIAALWDHIIFCVNVICCSIRIGVDVYSAFTNKMKDTGISDMRMKPRHIISHKSFVFAEKKCYKILQVSLLMVVNFYCKYLYEKRFEIQ